MDNQPNPSPATEEPVTPDNQSVPQAPTEPLGAEPNSTAIMPAVVEPVSSRRKLWLVVGIVAVLIIAGVLTYMVARENDKASDNAAQTSSASSNQAGNSSVNDATSSMTQGATGEAPVTNTDDSGTANSMNQSASNVGDSINENNF